MNADIIDQLRPDLIEVDPVWDEHTLATIMVRASAHGPDRAKSRRRQVGLVATAAAVVGLLAGGVFAAQRWLPREDVTVAGPGAPTGVPPVDAPYAKELSRLDESFPTLPTDRVFDVEGTRDFPLGKAPADSYIFYKIAAECPDGTKYLFILNGDRNAASATCGAKDDVSSSAGEFSDKVAAGSENVVTIEVNRKLRYTLTVGYRTKSINDVGPRGTLPDGRTYGYQEGKIADMVPVHGISGVDGYVDRADLEGPMPSSPEEAVRERKAKYLRYRNGERIDRQVPVLDTEGRQVDVFNIELPKPR